VPPEYEEHAQTFRSSPPPSAGFGEVDLPPLQLSRPPPSMTSAATVAAPRTSATATGVVRQADGGVNYGEVNLDGGDTSSFDADGDGDGDPRRHDEDMEFGAIPQQAPTYSRAPTALATARTELAPAARPVAPTEPMSPTRPRSRRTTRVVAASLATVVIAGGALALVPAVGPFGAYWVSDQLKRREHESLVQSTVQRARAALRQDTHRAAASAASAVDGARTSAPRVKALPAYAAFIGYLRELRFGAHAATRARAQVGLDELADAHDGDVAHLQLARAARAAVQGQLARARAEVGALAQKNARDVDALVLAGELELRGSDARAALSAWQRAAAVEPGPRTAFGLARAHRALGDEPRAVEHAEAALKANPEHVGGKVLIAEVIWRARHDETRALALLDSVVKQPAAASAQELVSAFTVLGDVHLERSRISHAEAAYGNALKIDPKAAGALNGLGDALFRAGRYSEALARYEAAAQADPDDLAAKVGVAKAKLALEQLQDSLEMLKKLREGNAKSLLVNYWYGRAQEAAGDRPSAEAAYRAAIALEGGEQTLVDAYVALALLLNQLGRGEEAQKLLAEAKTKLKSSPAVHKALGELALQQGRDAAAIESFQRALELDPADVGATFRLGIALRRTRRFDEANRMLDAVSAVDRDFPGLALERGLLYESSGRSEEALKAYEGALAKAPNDVDLMLRVGCSKVIGGRPEQAVELLRKVLVQRPSSAETNHCLGRGLLLEGNNLAEALRLLERAVELDPHRAEHHLYVGWAANEAGRVAQAERSLAQALTIDQGLGDAYWQRGLLRYRQGAVKDAVEDLRRALELSPSRFEAHAALADSLYDLGREPDAIREWQAAVQAQPDNPTWRFRYGKLLAINHRNNEAREHLAKAIEVGEQQDSKPRWLWEAHHLIARAYGGTKEAVRHWEEFLKLGPRDSPYRSEAKAALEKLGRPYTGD
jgi:tetratricopeptide (TPR) repeat protein